MGELRHKEKKIVQEQSSGGQEIRARERSNTVSKTETY